MRARPRSASASPPNFQRMNRQNGEEKMGEKIRASNLDAGSAGRQRAFVGGGAPRQDNAPASPSTATCVREL